MRRTEDLSWEERAARLIRMQLAATGLNQEELASLLSVDGEAVSAQSVRSKLARGTFSAAFMLKVLDALECDSLDMSAY